MSTNRMVYSMLMTDHPCHRYAFHEIPVGAREQITYEARRLLKPKGALVIVDIDPTYMPSKNMLLGEPYIQEYRHNIDRQLAVLSGFSDVYRRVVIPGHVISWTLTKCDGLTTSR